MVTSTPSPSNPQSVQHTSNLSDRSNPYPCMPWYSCSIWCYLCKIGCYQHPRWCYHHTVWRYWILIQRFPCLDREMWGSTGKASPSAPYLEWGIKQSSVLSGSRCVGPQARVVTVPAHAVSFNEDRRRRWLRVNYNLMLESNTISPFITPQCHGLTGSHQLVKGTHVEKAMLR